MDKPYSEACYKNREPILTVLIPLLYKRKAVLEIGSGTGQHAVYFAEKMPHLIWYTSDVKQNHDAINLWLNDAGLPNTRPPAILNVKQPVWPMLNIDTIFSANTAHIMHWDEVEYLFAGSDRTLPAKGLFLLYGPFNYNSIYTSESNEQFDYWLKEQDPLSGLRNFEDLTDLAASANLELIKDFEMPANNRILCWEKR